MTSQTLPAQTQRTQTDVTVTFRNHAIRAECGTWTTHACIYHDGRLMAAGWPWFEETFSFPVSEEGEWAQYDVTVRGPGMSPLLKPCFTVRRNGQVLFDDR